MDVLEKVKVGDKLRFRDGISIDEKPSRMSRWLAGENKDVTINGITDIIERAIAMNMTINERVVTSLENLKVTYKSCKSIVQSLNDLQLMIQEYSYGKMIREKEESVRCWTANNR
jgi:hypothetical protein